MSMIREMIERLCPEGAEWKKLAEVTKTFKGTYITKKESREGSIPVVLGGQEPAYYIDVSNHEGEIVVVSRSGASAGFVSYWNEPVFITDGFGFEVDSSVLSYRYLYYALKRIEASLQKMKRGAGVPHVSHKDLVLVEIPVPPIEVQEEIVKVLDSFTELDVILNAELAARKKQFLWVQQQCFSNKTFMFNRRLEDCCVLAKGATPIQKAIPGEYPLVVTTATRRTSSTYQFTEPSVCIPLVSSRGHGVASLNSVYYQEGKFALGNILCGVTPKDQKDLNAKYLYYYLNYKKDSLIVPLMKGGANVSLTVDTLKKIVVSYPSIEEQNRVVSMLELFDAFFDEGKGLPAEIKARQQQYEFYRDQLLTFKRAN